MKLLQYNIIMTSNAEKLQLSLNKERVEVPDAIDFIIHIVYNFPKSKKTVAHSRYATAIKTSKMGKSLTTLEKSQMTIQNWK